MIYLYLNMHISIFTKLTNYLLQTHYRPYIYPTLKVPKQNKITIQSGLPSVESSRTSMFYATNVAWQVYKNIVIRKLEFAAGSQFLSYLILIPEFYSTCLFYKDIFITL